MEVSADREVSGRELQTTGQTTHRRVNQRDKLRDCDFA